MASRCSSLYLPRARHGDGDRYDSGRPDVTSRPDIGGRAKVDARWEPRTQRQCGAAAHGKHLLPTGILVSQRARTRGGGASLSQFGCNARDLSTTFALCPTVCHNLSVTARAVLSPRSCAAATLRPTSPRAWWPSSIACQPGQAAVDLVAARALPCDAECAVASELLLLRITLFCEALRLRMGVAER